MKKNIFLITLTFLISLISVAQTRTISAGGQVTGTGGTLDYSVGLVDYITVTGAGGTITQGLQQPYEIFRLETEDPKLLEGITLFPNPTSGLLVLEIKNTDSKKINYVITDTEGKLIESRSVFDDQTSIDLSNHANQTYFLSLILKGQDLKVYKIVKTH